MTVVVLSHQVLGWLLQQEKWYTEGNSEGPVQFQLCAISPSTQSCLSFPMSIDLNNTCWNLYVERSIQNFFSREHNLGSSWFCFVFFFFNFFFFFTTPHGLWDLSCLTKDQSVPPAADAQSLTTRLPGKPLGSFTHGSQKQRKPPKQSINRRLNKQIMVCSYNRILIV